MNLIFTSNNNNKIIEIQNIVPNTISIISLREAGITEELPEPYFTFEENAFAKADHVWKQLNISCFSEDSGLIVPALNNEPGVWSARYAGLPSNDVNNNRKLLNRMEKIKSLEAYYKSVICLILSGKSYYFDGACTGTIINELRGHSGFGYDPMFIPAGEQKTFGEMQMEEKLKFSHRTKAFEKLVDFLTKTI